MTINKHDKGSMEEQKTEIVEKRLSRGVIRRRSRNVEEKPTAQQKEASSTKEAKVKRKVEAPVQPPKEETKTLPRGLILDDQQKKAAELNLQRNLKQTTKVEKTEHKVTEKIITKESILKKESPPPKPEKKKVLTFKDRVKGTIDLQKFKETKEEEGVDQERNLTAPKVLDESDETEKKSKTARVKKGVKAIGGDLDIDGQGRATHLSYLTRGGIADRVFRPGSVGRSSKRKKILSRKNLKSTAITTKKASKRVIGIDQGITVANLAQELGVKAAEIIKKLMDLGMMATMNQVVDKDTATLIAAEYKYEVKDISFKEEEVLQSKKSTDEDLKDAPMRAPVVTVMGHVDHGKTSLLDAIRSTSVTTGEAGGITQHIGAYTVSLPEGKITFIDTPGHEAFTTMRSRGAQVTDIVILVVAADDGMMPQTEESIDHAKAAGVPIIVAVNKIDKEEANPERIKRQLSEKGLLSEEWGGETIFNEVSAKTKKGIPELLESILLQAEILELKAPDTGFAKGSVLESKLDRNRGPLCTLLVQQGALKVGDYVVAGEYAGKIRAMLDWNGESLQEAGPSMAIEILGLEGVPEAGDSFNSVKSEQDARKITDFRKEEKRKQGQGTVAAVSLEDMFSRMKAGDVSELNIILKADVQGSLEAVKDAILKIGNEEVQAKIIHAAVGGINESDVRLAMASQAVIIGFNIRPETKAIHIAKDNKVDIKLYKVIYDLVHDVKLAMEGLLSPDINEEYLGRAEVRQTFDVSKLGTIAGSMVVDGVITRTANLRLLRDNVVIFEGTVASLRRFKDDAKEVKQGFECGIGIEGFKDIKEGDVIEAFKLVEIQKTL